jgi:hypothetical protein
MPGRKEVAAWLATSPQRRMSSGASPLAGAVGQSAGGKPKEHEHGLGQMETSQGSMPTMLATLLAEVRSMQAKQDATNRLLEKLIAASEDNEGFNLSALKSSSETLTVGASDDIGTAEPEAPAWKSSLSPVRAERIAALVKKLRKDRQPYHYAVVSWYNYRKELSAGFIKGFDDQETAEDYAYALAVLDMERHKSNNSGKIITEDDITDNNGPCKEGSPYWGRTIVGYGGRCDNGYATTFYCVVPWFDGVENEWDESHYDCYWEDKYDGEWYPKYDP